MRLRYILAAGFVFCASANAYQPSSVIEGGAESNADIEAAAKALEAVADGAADEAIVTAEVVLGSDGMWEPSAHYNPLIEEFLSDAKPIAEGKLATQQMVADKYGLSLASLDELVRFLRRMSEYGYDNEKKRPLRNEALQLIKSKRAPVTLVFAAAALDHVGDGCSSADIDLLMKGSRSVDADWWAVATGCLSSGAFAAALGRSPKIRPALSYLLMNWSHGDPASELAATDMLLDPDFLAQVEPEQRDRIHADIARYKLVTLLKLGFNGDAVAFADSLPPSVLALALKRDREPIRTSIGGFGLTTSPYYETPTAGYAAALALVGRVDGARRALDLIAPATRRKEARACLDAAEAECPVGGRDGVPVAALEVDQFLDQPNADPYVLVESQAGSFISESSGATGLLCKLELPKEEQESCEDARRADAISGAYDEIEQEEDSRALWAEIRRVGGPAFEAARAGYAAKLGVAKPVKKAEQSRASRVSVDPAPVPFRELPLPASLARARLRPEIDPKSLGSLPEGYSLVRADRDGRHVAAISISQRLDPNGEVTAGGYWLHLSDDGGKSWREPLYTGLAEHFPYIVPEKSRLPLVKGDHVQLEVEEALIDTASITYPPVGMALKRQRKGIYLDMPIAELAKDSDGDGLTDIAARHLLLDQPVPDRTPFIVSAEQDCSTSRPDTQARIEVLKKIFSVEARALIEPVGPRKQMPGPWRTSSPSAKPPIFLLGDPDDFRCIVLDRSMIVYSEADRERLRRHSPDFQLVTLPPIRWNRDHSRGFVNWSMGWAGGTFRLIRRGDGWKLESISEWVT